MNRETTSVQTAPPGQLGWATVSDGQRIRYERFGDGPAALVFIHGGMCDRSFWQAQVADFSRDYCVVLIDLPGHGQSDTGRTNWSLDGLGADVASAARQAFAGPVFLVGHSVGGAIALEAARRLEQSVAGVVVLDFLHQPSAAPTAPPMPPGGIPADAQAIRAGMAAAIRKGMFTEACDEEFAGRVINQMLSFSAPISGALRAAAGAFDAVASLRALAHVPVALLQSDRRPTDVADVAAARAGTRVWRINNVGHFLMLEQPTKVNAILRTELMMMQNATTLTQ